MRTQPRSIRAILLIVSGIILIAGLTGFYFLYMKYTQPLSIIARENAHPGTSSWKIPAAKAASIEIQAYADATSVLPGQKITFYVSAQVEGTRYTIDIYRLGWYGGLGGRLMTKQTGLMAHAQGYYDPQAHQLVRCFSCHVDTKTGLVEANWQPSYVLVVPSNWVTGVYLAKFTDANDKLTYTPFDVRGNTQSLYVAVTSDTTYAAYNGWGGYSLYEYNTYDKTHKLTRAVKVSFDRPYDSVLGSGDVLAFEADAIRWMERQGYDLSYMSSVDLHEHPMQLLQHKAYLSIGHDEYWTKEMRDGVEYARDHGVGLAFFEANDSYWQIRFEPDSAGTADRTIVCYKVQTPHQDLALDPLYGKDNSRVTSQWRDPVINRPENAMIGIMYSSEIHGRQGFPWQVNPQIKSPLLDGTGLQPGHLYGCDLVGYEWDSISNNGHTPSGLQILGVSHVVDYYNRPDLSNTTYYIAPSGAFVFATGSIYWTVSLDSYRYSADKFCSDQNLVVPGMQILMAQVMDALLIHYTAQQLASAAVPSSPSTPVKAVLGMELLPFCLRRCVKSRQVLVRASRLPSSESSLKDAFLS